ncbi:MAG: hypothetical protein FIB07_16440 [Candidatus Methanoperedens sp.]|nr:hypothetical protein [Candidatus Methanoperedens sp.]
MNLWKAFALIMIALLVIATGLRFTYFGAHTFQINEEQRSFAINAARNGLKEEIGNNNYSVIDQERGLIISTLNGEKRVIYVVLKRENITLTALIDMETGNIVEKNKMESSGWMIDYKDQNSRRWGHQRFLDR